MVNRNNQVVAWISEKFGSEVRLNGEIKNTVSDIAKQTVIGGAQYANFNHDAAPVKRVVSHVD